MYPYAEFQLWSDLVELTLKMKKKYYFSWFSLTLGYTMLYLSMIVLLPLSMIFLNTLSMSWSEFYETITHPGQ